jgi:hypothetical protein
MLTFADLARRIAIENIRKFANRLDLAEEKNDRLRDELERERDRRVAAEHAIDAEKTRASVALAEVKRALKLAPSGVIERALATVHDDILREWRCIDENQR